MAFDGSAIKALLDGAVAKGAVHGIAAVVVDRNGALFHHAAGEANERTLFRNASMTKAVATTGALQLVEQGRLDLDATVESILPEFGKLQLLEGFDGDTAAPARAGQQGHGAPADDAHRRPGLLLHQRKADALPGADRRAEPAVGREAQPVGADGQRPGHRVGVRRQHRLAGAGRSRSSRDRAWAATCSSTSTRRWA